MEAQDKERSPAKQKAGRKSPRLPLKEIDERNKQRIRELNGEFLNLYRVIGHNPNMLAGWIEFAYTLRRDCTTSRSLPRADDPARRAARRLGLRVASAPALGAAAGCSAGADRGLVVLARVAAIHRRRMRGARA